MAGLKKLDVVVLLAGDGDYVPLVRKLNSLGVKVMVLGWDIEYVNENNVRIVTRSSQELLEEASYPLSMHSIIEDRAKRNEMLINNLFVSNESRKPVVADHSDIGEGKTGEIMSLKNGFGFIKFPPNNVFFHFSNLMDSDFQDLQVGDPVQFDLERGDEGQDVAKNVRILAAY
jgi:cold shock CspA family protein